MKKLFVKILCGVLAAGIMCSGLVACSSSSGWKGTSMTNGGSGSVYGGFIGETENYLYFINGMPTSTANNEYGAPVKGALMAADKSDLTKTEVVVPKLFAASDYNAGIYIYGGYVYYGTPSTDKDSTGAVANTELQFMRTKLDGSDATDAIVKVNSLSVEYRFVQKDGKVFLVYYDSAETQLVSFDVEKGEKTVIAKTDATAAGVGAKSLAAYRFLDGEAAKNGYAVAYTMTVYKEDYFKDKVDGGSSRATENYNLLYVYGAGDVAAEGETAAGTLVADGKTSETTYAVTYVYGGNVYYTATDAQSKVKTYSVAAGEAATAATEIKNADYAAAGNFIVGADAYTVADGKIVKHTLTGDDNAEKQVLALASSASTIVYVDTEGGFAYYFNSDNQLARIKLNDETAEETRISEGTVATTWYKPCFVTVGNKKLVVYLDNSTTGASYLKYADLAAEVKGEDTDDDEEDDLFYIEGQEFLGKLLPEDQADIFETQVRKITDSLENGALPFEEDADGKLILDTVGEARKAYNALSDEVKEKVDDSTLTTLSDYEKAIEMANVYNKLKDVKNYVTWTDDEKASVKAIYDEIKDEIEAFRNSERYETIRALLGNDLNRHYQKAVELFEETEEE